MFQVVVVVTVVTGLVSACGDDGVHHLPDAPPGPAVALTVSPPSIVLASGETRTVTATIDRTGGFAGSVDVAATPPSADLVITGGTIAADGTSVELTVMAIGTATSAMRDVPVTATATGVSIAPQSLAVRIAGRVGSAIGGEAAGDQAGTAVALSADGKRIIIGSPFNDTTGADGGSARVFERSGDTWVQVGGDLDGEAAGDRYAGAVSISNDGSRVAIGAYHNDGGGVQSGHVRVFDLVGGAWTQVGADIDGLSGADGHGWAVELSGTGARVVVGAPVHSGTNGTSHVWELAGGVWTAVGAPLTGNREHGHAVAISDDGNRIAVGSPSAAGVQYPGHVDVYDWNGSAWVVAGAPIMGTVPAEGTGTTVALSADGNTLAIGSPQNDTAGANTGELRVYRWNASSAGWQQLGTSIAGVAGYEIGSALSISADGTRLVAGGPSGGGTARFYTFANGTWAMAPGPDFGTGARAGTSVAISPDGRTAAVGAPYASSPGNLSGEVRVYDLP